MLKLVSQNPSPVISSLRLRRHATSQEEADEIFSQNSGNHIVPIDTNNMPYTELQSELSEEERPVIKKFRAGEEFRLAVYNFSARPDVPFMGFSIESVDEVQKTFTADGAIIDPSKSRLTKLAVAAIPLLHIFNETITAEAKRAAGLIGKASTNQGVVSFDKEYNKRMMDAALTGTYNCMLALYGREKLDVEEQPKMGADCLMEKLCPSIDASASFYEALIHRTRELFELSIRTLAERIALGSFSATHTGQTHTLQ